jgi:trehalose 6-phosphate synthase
MPKTLKFLAALIIGLGILSWAAADVVQKTTRQWFDKDIALRMRLVADTIAPTLAPHLSRNDVPELERILSSLARHERIMAVALCRRDGVTAARTPAFPADISCSEIQRKAISSEQSGTESGEWGAVWPVVGGDVQVSAVAVVDNADAAGWLVLVHDLTFIERREHKTKRFLLLAFAVLAAGASLVTVIAARLSWLGFRNELRRFLQGKRYDKFFVPLLREVRELVDRLASEREMDGQSGRWTPERLQKTLVRHFPGERVVVLANREPYIHQRTEDGGIAVMHPASGLVTAVEPVLRACSGIWVAHGSGSGDRETVDKHDRVLVPPGEESYLLRRVWLTREEELAYYYGFANEGLWPLCHLAHTRPIFRSKDWEAYVEVNRRFAAAVCDEAAGDDPVVLVQDYHFALAPRFIRERLPHAVIITFWHIPWPNPERLGICQWHNQILEALLGSSIVGFHTQLHCNNFLDSADRYLEARVDRECAAVVQHGRPTLVRPYPISLAWPNPWVTSAPPVNECRKAVFAELGLAPDALLAVGVDRLDYTKGIEERLLAVECLLDRYPDYQGRFTFVQLAAPSRSAIDRYRQLDERVEQLCERINGKFSRDNWHPIVLLRAHHEPPTVFRHYRAANLCYVSSLHDGMNLVAKEFVAAREDEAGVLVLSRFTGAASEMPEALIVNPYDLEEASAAMVRALTMPPEEQRARMRAMRAQVAESNVYGWAGRMLLDASRIRQRATILERLDSNLGALAKGQK